jgi:hypothetical protein
VLVVNGGYGRDVYGLSSVESTLNGDCWILANSARASGNLATLDANQGGFELATVALREVADQVPIGRRNERHPLPLALDDEPHRHALHAAGRQFRPNLAPQQRRNFVSVQAVDDPPRFLGSHQIGVDVARIRQGFFDRLPGDFMKHQPANGHLGLEDFSEMPTDGFAFAVFVRRQEEVFGFFEQALEFLHLGRLSRGNNVQRGKALVHIDAQARPLFLFELGGDLTGPLR